jgi:hypothetical protein
MACTLVQTSPLEAGFVGLSWAQLIILRCHQSFLQDPLGHLLLGFRYQATYHLYPRAKPKRAWCDGCVKESHIG